MVHVSDDGQVQQQKPVKLTRTKSSPSGPIERVSVQLMSTSSFHLCLVVYKNKKFVL